MAYSQFILMHICVVCRKKFINIMKNQQKNNFSEMMEI